MTTDRYDGDTRDRRIEHLYHLTATPPDLAPYVCLPVGFRFNFTQREEVWCVPEIAALSPEGPK
jgi:hypothetical protein